MSKIGWAVVLPNQQGTFVFKCEDYDTLELEIDKRVVRFTVGPWGNVIAVFTLSQIVGVVELAPTSIEIPGHADGT